MALSVSVVLPTHDRPDSLRRAVEAILAQTRKPCELIIVNDGAEEIDPSLEQRAERAGVPMTCLRQETASSSRSRNRGMAAAGGDVVLLVDDDVVLPGDYLGRLAGLYGADEAAQVAGIGGRYRRAQPKSIGERTWDLVSAALGQVQWGPRVVAARYVSLPPALRGQLVPARLLVGGVISLRRDVAHAERFCEALTGYAFGEDREFTCRVGQRRALFVAPRLAALHDRAPGGRPDLYRLGGTYVAQALYIARHSVEGGAGTWLLVGYDLLGTLLRYVAWGLLRPRGGNLRFAAGVAAELFAAARGALGRALCGC